MKMSSTSLQPALLAVRSFLEPAHNQRTGWTALPGHAKRTVGRFAGRHLLVAAALLSNVTLRALGFEDFCALCGVARWSLREAGHGRWLRSNKT